MSGYYNKIVDRNWVRSGILKTWAQKMGAEKAVVKENEPPP